MGKVAKLPDDQCAGNGAKATAAKLKSRRSKGLSGLSFLASSKLQRTAARRMPSCQVEHAVQYFAEDLSGQKYPANSRFDYMR